MVWSLLPHLGLKSSSRRSWGGVGLEGKRPPLSSGWCAAKRCVMTTTPSWYEGEWDGFAAFAVGKVSASLSL